MVHSTHSPLSTSAHPTSLHSCNLIPSTRPTSHSERWRTKKWRRAGLLETEVLAFPTKPRKFLRHREKIWLWVVNLWLTKYLAVLVKESSDAPSPPKTIYIKLDSPTSASGRSPRRPMTASTRKRRMCLTRSVTRWTNSNSTKIELQSASTFNRLWKHLHLSDLLERSTVRLLSRF